MKMGYLNYPMSFTYRLPKLPEAVSPKLSKQAKLRLKWFDFYFSHQENAELTCRHFGISKKTFYKWKKRYHPYQLETLEDRSKRPHTFRKSQIPHQTVDLVVKLRKKYPAWSKYKLEVILKRDHQVTLSSSSIGRILKTKGLIKEKESKRRKRAAKRRRLRVSKELKVEGFGDLVQLDTKHFNLPWSKKRYQLQAIDVIGKIKFSKTFSHLSSRKAKEFFLEALNNFPYPVKAVQTDNGSEFLKEFDDLLKKLDIPHYFTYPSSPKQNSVVERSIQTDIKEFYEQCNFASDEDEQNKLLACWNDTYNNFRPHQSLGYLTPNQYYERHKNNQLALKPLKIAYVKSPETVYHVLDQNKNLTWHALSDSIAPWFDS